MAQVNLEKFMRDTQDGTGFTFDTFHRMFHYVNTRMFGNALYAQIKNNQITVQELVSIMKAAI